jgi:hypothetical protein
MMSSNRKDYASASEWLSALRQDEAWLSQQQRLQTSTDGDTGVHIDAAMRRIGDRETFEFWEIYRHQVEPVVSEVWDIAELSLPKLKIQTIGMLSMEWLEQHAAKAKKTGVGSNSANDSLNVLPTNLTSEEAMKYWKRLQEAGFVDTDCKLLPETTRKQAMCIAEDFSERIGVKSKWKTFERFWGINNLAQEKWEIQQTGTLPTRSEEIDLIFED